MEHSTGLIDATEEFPEAAKALHIAYYIPVNWGIQDRISRSLVDFQHARDPQAMQWIRLTALLAGQMFSCDVIVRALSSKEKSAGGSEPLDKACQELARRMSVPYAPERLQKTRQTQAVKNAGGRPTRMKLLLDSYRFDASGLSDPPRVLIVDDVITTGATLSAIATAIRKSSSAAEILFLALARTEPHLTRFHLEQSPTPIPDIASGLQKVNAHLDERYFFGTTSPVAFRPRPIPSPSRTPSPAPRSAPAAPVAASPEPVIHPGTPVTPAVRPAPVLTFDEAPEFDRKPTDLPRTETQVDDRKIVRTAARPAVFKRRGLVATGLGITAVLILAFFLVKRGEEEPAAEQKAVHEESATRNPSMADYPKLDLQPPPAPKSPSRPRMEVALPSVGLRSDPGFDGAPLHVSLTEGEKVVILERYVAVSGPNWVRVRTRSGKTGWLFAGALRADTAKSAGMTGVR